MARRTVSAKPAATARPSAARAAPATEPAATADAPAAAPASPPVDARDAASTAPAPDEAGASAGGDLPPAADPAPLPDEPERRDYPVGSWLCRNGRKYREGDTVALTEAEAETLVALGALAEDTVVPALPTDV